jgi:hypothetical protein
MQKIFIKLINSHEILIEREKEIILAMKSKRALVSQTHDLVVSDYTV